MSSKIKIQISNASLSDLDALHELERDAFTDGNSASREAFEYRLTEFPQWFFKAVYNDRIIGFINGSPSDKQFITDDLFLSGASFNADAENFLVFGLVVHRDFRGLGIASSLMRNALSVSKERGKKRAALTCEKSLIPFYEQFGFNNCGVSESVVGGIQYFDMEITLSD